MARKLLRHAFDRGINHFDLANNYGPPPGHAEAFLGEQLRNDFKHLRQELLISTKAGFDMWPGPYGSGGSRKHVLQSLDASLQRMGLDHVDIFYSHVFDKNTPIEETVSALITAYQQGKALYIGISNHRQEPSRQAMSLLKDAGVPCVLHQMPYSILNRWVVEDGLLDVLDEFGVGGIAFSPLAQGLLTEKYLTGVPKNSRASKGHGALSAEAVEQQRQVVQQLKQLADQRGQSLPQLALSWVPAASTNGFGDYRREPPRTNR